MTNYFYCTHQLNEDLANTYVEKNIVWLQSASIVFGLITLLTLLLALPWWISKKKSEENIWTFLFVIFFCISLFIFFLYLWAKRDIFSFLC